MSANILQYYSSKRKEGELIEDIEIITKHITTDMIPDEIKKSIVKAMHTEVLNHIIDVYMEYPDDVLHIKHEHTIKHTFRPNGYEHTIKYTLLK